LPRASGWLAFVFATEQGGALRGSRLNG
jgi:hypothetical protein